MRGGVLFLPGFQLFELVQPAETSLDVPAGLAEAAAVSRVAFGQEALYPLFLSAWRCGSES